MISSEQKEVLALIAKGESKTVEFKSTLRIDLKTGNPAAVIEHSVLKTLAAFLNTEGGYLLIGVEDNRNILGLEPDFEGFKGQDKFDEFQKHFDNVFEKIGNRFQRYVDLSFHRVAEKFICQIKIKEKSASPVYTKDEKKVERFYIRRKGSSIELQPSEAAVYILEHWQRKPDFSRKKASMKQVDKFSSQEAFRNEMRRLLADTNSKYYTEIKGHWNSHSLVEHSLLLKELCKDQLGKSIDFGLLPIISDWARNHLYYDREAKYIYNQPHVYSHNVEEEGYNLPLYYHIRFIGILYATAIRNNKDIDLVSRRFKSMISIYSGMIEAMFDNMEYEAHSGEMENPTNYHWMLSEIFSTIANWVDQLNEKGNFRADSGYIRYIPANMQDCLSELYKGLAKNKVSIDFVVRKFYYNVLTNYFSPLLNDIIRDAFEQEIIAYIPGELTDPILKFSLDEAFAIRVDEFYSDRGHLNNDSERKVLRRLKDFLASSKVAPSL